MPDLRGLGAEIRRLRIEQGLTPEQLAERSRVKVADLLAVEAGEDQPLRNTVVSLAKGLGVSPTALLRMMR